MAMFSYTAKDTQGRTIEGSVDVSSAQKAGELLLSNQLIPISILPVKMGGGISIPFFGNRVSNKQLMTFTRQMATMIGAGLPITQSLKTMRQQTDNQMLRKAIDQIIKDVEAGSPLSTGLERYPKLFDQVYVNLVRVGETAGKLDSVMVNLANQVEKSYEFKQKVRSAMVYPVMIFFAMSVVVMGMLIFVVPQMKDVYESFDAKLPLNTRIVLAVSDFMVKRFYIVGILLFVGIILLQKFRDSTTGKLFFSKAIRYVPVIGKLSQSIQLTEFSRTLGLLVTSGVPILQSLEIAGDGVKNVVIHDGIVAATKQVERGVAIAAALSSTTNFPPMITQMIMVGEQTGKLDEVLIKVADTLQQDTDAVVNNLAAAIEPMILIFLGVVVGFLVLSMIMPIYELTNQMGI